MPVLKAVWKGVCYLYWTLALVSMIGAYMSLGGCINIVTLLCLAYVVVVLTPTLLVLGVWACIYG